MSVSLGATCQDDARLQSLSGAAPSAASVDAPGHHFGFSSVLSQLGTRVQQTQTVAAAQTAQRAAPTPTLSGTPGVACTPTVNGVCQITSGVMGTWVKTGPTIPSEPPNQFTLSASVPS